jgi:tetratricopeptide (TPR) repeat protein
MEASLASTAPTEANPATGTSSAGSSTNTCEDIKSRGNELFVKNDFAGAEELYTQAIDQFTDSRAILYTNRSAARLGLNNFTGALEDSERAIAADPTWTKAYYRKATALEKLNRHRDCYLAWRQAAILCEHTAWLQKQIKAASEQWVKKFKVVPIESTEDLMERFKILSNSRQRLSTLAHFWNESTEGERFQHFQFLLTVIGGEGDLSEVNRRLTEKHMQPMPLHNYVDLPRDHIAAWCDYFREQSPEAKTEIMHLIWEALESAEKDAVVADLKVFVARAYELEALMSQSSSGASKVSDDDLD